MEAAKQLECEMALNVYRQLGDAAMVLSLQSLQNIEEKTLLAGIRIKFTFSILGHLAELLGDYTTAETLFLSSSNPISALEMQRDLLHWVRNTMR